ncbi:MAG: hypothetical protein AVDCRST_MAG49-4714, partial [uncultured Thermomicrobiales bacterium]
APSAPTTHPRPARLARPGRSRPRRCGWGRDADARGGPEM